MKNYFYNINRKNMRVSVLCTLFYAYLALGFTPMPFRNMNRINGVVLSATTGKPVSGALVYVVLGEEEALTKTAGTFSLETSHVYPVEILTEHRDYLKQSVILKMEQEKLVIRLKPRIK